MIYFRASSFLVSRCTTCRHLLQHWAWPLFSDREAGSMRELVADQRLAPGPKRSSSLPDFLSRLLRRGRGGAGHLLVPEKVAQKFQQGKYAALVASYGLPRSTTQFRMSMRHLWTLDKHRDLAVGLHRKTLTLVSQHVISMGPSAAVHSFSGGCPFFRPGTPCCTTLPTLPTDLLGATHRTFPPWTSSLGGPEGNTGQTTPI